MSGPDTGDRRQFESVYERLREAVLHGDFVPGTPVSQVQLARVYETSRSPVREAFRMLQREGLVEAEPGRRTRIAAVTAPDLEQLYALRIAVEALAVRVTMRGTTAADLDELRRRRDEMEALRDSRDFDAWERPHRAFHLALVGGAGVRLVATATELLDHAERYRRIFLREPAGWATAAAEHDEIVEAVAARDGAAAASLLARHLARTALTVAATLDPDYEPAAVREALRLVVTPDS